MDDTKQIEKAEVIVHWATGPVLCCIDHAEKLIAIGRVMGQHTPAVLYTGDEDCTNCVNEARKRK